MVKPVILLFVIVFTLISLPSFSQDVVHLNKFKVLTRSGETEGVEGVLDVTALKWTQLDGKEIVIPRTEIRSLYEYKGSMAGNYALKGAGAGLLCGLLGVLSAYGESSSDPYSEVNEDKIMPLLVGFTAGGALIGGLIGSGKEVMERVPVHVQPVVSSRSVGIRLGFAVPF